MESNKENPKVNENIFSNFSFRTNSPQEFKRGFSKNRELHGKLYQKGWFYERKAMEIILKKALNQKNNLFLVKSPYSYPFDVIGFSQNTPNIIYLFEIKFTYGHMLTIYKQKIKRAKNFIKRYHNWNFKYVVMVFWGSSLAYDFYELDLDKTPKNVILKPRNLGENANIL